MGKIIDRVREREAHRVCRLIAEAERQRLQRTVEAHPAYWFWLLMERLRKRDRDGCRS